MTTDTPLTSHWASTEIFFVERGQGGCLFEGGCLLTFCAFRVGAYSRWVVNRIKYGIFYFVFLFHFEDSYFFTIL